MHRRRLHFASPTGGYSSVDLGPPSYLLGSSLLLGSSELGRSDPCGIYSLGSSWRGGGMGIGSPSSLSYGSPGFPHRYAGDYLGSSSYSPLASSRRPFFTFDTVSSLASSSSPTSRSSRPVVIRDYPRAPLAPPPSHVPPSGSTDLGIQRDRKVIKFREQGPPDPQRKISWELPSAPSSPLIQRKMPPAVEEETQNEIAKIKLLKGEAPPPQRDKDRRLRFKKYYLDDFQFLKVLGKGSFGKVVLAELRNGTEGEGEEKRRGALFAIKCISKSAVLADDDVECAMIERKVLALGTHHPFICKLFCTFQTPSHLFFAMEYLSGGDLMFHIQREKKFPEDRARFYTAEMVSALKFLHRKGIVYRDMKLDNIVLDSEGHAKLVDFGMCLMRIYREECQPSNFCGTPHYMAPEILQGQVYNQSVDWWSLGIVLYELLVGQSPFNGTDEDELFWVICHEEPYFPKFLSSEAEQILKLMLDKTPATRLGMPNCKAGDICYLRFFSPIDWDRLEQRRLPPPFVPKSNAPDDVCNFERHITKDEAFLGNVDEEKVKEIDQDLFKGFSYTNPNMAG